MSTEVKNEVEAVSDYNHEATDLGGAMGVDIERIAKDYDKIIDDQNKKGGGRKSILAEVFDKSFTKRELVALVAAMH